VNKWVNCTSIHIFSADFVLTDAGAGNIAGMDLTGTGANEIVFAFTLWGAEQLIYSLIQWMVIFRYRSLVALMWVVHLMEIQGRVLAGYLKPVTFSHTPPGVFGNYIYLILSIFMLILALWSGYKPIKIKQLNI
jgi:hypothetical protein